MQYLYYFWRATKNKSFHVDNGHAEGCVKDVVIHRHRDDCNTYCLGPYSGLYYKASAFKDIPSFGFGLNIMGCKLGDGAKLITARPRQYHKINIGGIITIISTTDAGGEFA